MTESRWSKVPASPEQERNAESEASSSRMTQYMSDTVRLEAGLMLTDPNMAAQAQERAQFLAAAALVDTGTGDTAYSDLQKNSAQISVLLSKRDAVIGRLNTFFHKGIDARPKLQTIAGAMQMHTRVREAAGAREKFLSEHHMRELQIALALKEIPKASPIRMDLQNIDKQIKALIPVSLWFQYPRSAQSGAVGVKTYAKQEDSERELREKELITRRYLQS